VSYVPWTRRFKTVHAIAHPRGRVTKFRSDCQSDSGGRVHARPLSPVLRRFLDRHLFFNLCPVLDSNHFRTTISLHTRKQAPTSSSRWERLVRRRAVLSKKILVVEDSCHLRELLGKILASRGWDPILAESGREALAKLECQTPRIILMDMRLPDISGFGLAAILKKHPGYRNIPILAATGSVRRHSPAAVSFGRLR